jgi:dTDP-4-dehydrorhamnose reductase
MPDVDRCEREPEASHAVNVEGPAILLDEVARRHIPMVYFSSDYVFDGMAGPYREADVPHPLQTYGAHKVEAEGVLAQYTRTMIVRPAWIYSDELNPRNFVYRVVQDLRRGVAVRAAVDQFNTPTPAGALASHAVDALLAGYQGILHLAGPERMSRFDLVQRIAGLAGYSAAPIEPVRLAELALAAQRPASGGLISDVAQYAIDERFEDADFRQILTGP